MIYFLTHNETLCKVLVSFYIVVVFFILAINIALNQQKTQEVYFITKTNVVSQSYDRIL